ncbi:Uncharacterized protein dnl_30900 [Desulfonema limicola]|uniref:Uncharacterized protein n=1 Tax=Desulfonema limicola TaxID=45656 RepID=A0A975B8T2_9BACT|nr:Uncharacterized protein dnl_30900 [Desulfonema limicola]
MKTVLTIAIFVSSLFFSSAVGALEKGDIAYIYTKKGHCEVIILTKSSDQYIWKLFTRSGGMDPSKFCCFKT